MTLVATTTDQFRYLHIAQLRAAIRLHKATGIIPTRGATITRLFEAASKVTGKPYKCREHDKAISDLDGALAWARISMRIDSIREKIQTQTWAAWLDDVPLSWLRA